MFETPKSEEKNIYNEVILYNEINYIFNINKLNEDKLKFILLNKKTKDTKKYFSIYTLNDFKKLNKYFKMFDDLNELENDLINTIKENKIDIIKATENEISFNLKVLSRNDNNVIFKLKKAEIDEKDKINILSEKIEELEKNNEIKDKKLIELEKNNEIKDKKLIELENKVTNILQIIEDKNKKIESLEKDINELKKYFNNFNRDNRPINPKYENILNNSNIFRNKEEIQLLLNNISNNPKNLKLLYNSKIDGENIEKLIDTYTGKNDLIFLVKTIKSKRFGGYAHECFERNNFEKSDKKAFLFNLDTKQIYKSNGKDLSIWRGSITFDSINFGTGTDLRIFHKFLSVDNKTLQVYYDYNYNNDEYALNREKYFRISHLEIYQIL